MTTPNSYPVVTRHADLPRAYLYRVSSIEGAFATLVSEDGKTFPVCRALLPDTATADSDLVLTEDGRFVHLRYDEADQLIRTTMQAIAPRVAALVDMPEHAALTYIEETLLSERNRLLEGSV